MTKTNMFVSKKGASVYFKFALKCSNLLGLIGIEYNSVTKRYEKCVKFKRIRCLINLLLYFFYVGAQSYYYSFRFKGRLFIISLAGMIFLYMQLGLIGIIIFTTRKYEHLMVEMFNQLLNNFQLDFEHHKCLDVFLICLTSFYLCYEAYEHTIISYKISVHEYHEFPGELVIAMFIRFSVIYMDFIRTTVVSLFFGINIILANNFLRLNEKFQRNAEEARVIFSEHQELVRVSRSLYGCFSINILGLLGYLFVKTVVTLFAMKYASHATPRLHQYIDFLLCLGRIGFTLGLPMWCKYQADHMKTLWYRRIKNKHIFCYGLQIMHDKWELKPGGFFDVDFKLIFSIISAVSTYLVIIYQFILIEERFNKTGK